MGTKFERRERDFYPTPFEAVLPLIAHLKGVKYFTEPCAGDGRLVNHLENYGLECVWKSDILPLNTSINQADALNLKCFAPVITNPPWSRELLHPMIENFRTQVPTWFLFDAPWKHTLQAEPYMKYCRKIVSVGRIKWIENTEHVGLKDCCWYLFGSEPCETVFYTRNQCPAY